MRVANRGCESDLNGLVVGSLPYLFGLFIQDRVCILNAK